MVDSKVSLPSLKVEVDSEILVYIHVRGVCDGGHTRRLSFRAYVRDGLRTHVQYYGVHQLTVVTTTGLVQDLEIFAPFEFSPNFVCRSNGYKYEIESDVLKYCNVRKQYLDFH